MGITLFSLFPKTLKIYSPTNSRNVGDAYIFGQLFCSILYLYLYYIYISRQLTSVDNCTSTLRRVLYCTVLFCTVLYCTALCCTVLYCTVGAARTGHTTHRKLRKILVQNSFHYFTEIENIFLNNI